MAQAQMDPVAIAVRPARSSSYRWSSESCPQRQCACKSRSDWCSIQTAHAGSYRSPHRRPDADTKTPFRRDTRAAPRAAPEIPPQPMRRPRSFQPHRRRRRSPSCKDCPGPRPIYVLIPSAPIKPRTAARVLPNTKAIGCPISATPLFHVADVGKHKPKPTGPKLDSPAPSGAPYLRRLCSMSQMWESTNLKPTGPKSRLTCPAAGPRPSTPAPPLESPSSGNQARGCGARTRHNPPGECV